MGQFGTFFVEIILKLLHNCIAIADMSKKKQNKTSEVGESLLDLGLAWAVCVQCWGKRGSDGRFVEIETVFIDVLTLPPAGYLFFIDTIAPPMLLVQYTQYTWLFKLSSQVMQDSES